MRQKFQFLLGVILFILFFVFGVDAQAGRIYQNFEPDLGVPINIWSRTIEGVTSVVDRHDGVHLGQFGARYESGWNWNGLGINTMPAVVDFKQENNDRFTFWVRAYPHVTCQIFGCDTAIDNNIGVEIHDNLKYANNGVEVWTVKKARYHEWTKLEILFSQLPPDFDLTQISQIQFINYWPGKYYLDDFHAVREDRIYQSFNRESRQGTTDSDYGWRWNDADTVRLSIDGEPVYEGSNSWKMVLNGKWDGGGIQSEQQNYYFNPDTNQSEQSFWHNNFLPENNDRLSLWIYALPENGMDNNLNVQIYDHGLHSTDQTKAEYWGKIAARSGHWSRIEVPFNKLPVDLNLHDIDKIQIQNYWAGTFYIDDIRLTGPHPTIKENTLAQGNVSWSEILGAENYRLQQSVDGPEGPWVTIYSGALNSFNVSSLSASWLRVRWEEKFDDAKTIPYYSPWSDVVEYSPSTVNLIYNTLLTGKILFNSIPQATLYQIQTASSITGPWTPFYKGPSLSSPLTATLGQWYRVRAIKENGGVLTDFGVWSRPQQYLSVGTGFVKASGTVLKDQDGTGNELVLTGYNLGNYLLTEGWMTGLGTGDRPVIPDEWGIRDVLTTRFGAAKMEEFFRAFENAYLTDYDFDLLAKINVTVVRLPIFYRNLMDVNGNFILNSQGQIDFSQIDRVVDAMANRGIYTLIDLHGAPGAQSAEFHTGHIAYNKLFEASPLGESYRTQTETLWKEIAKHYKNNTWVLGYDLLNEPVGAPSPTTLADFYDRLYDAIRLIDPNHVIMMEGIWDWETLPNPADHAWQNVVYQFHYYCPMISEPQNPADPVPVLGQSCADYGPMDFRFSFQKAFIDNKVATSLQNVYQVPAMVGEFSVHDDKASWEYYLQTFNAQKWSWTVWSYKDISSPSNWGIVNHAKYDEDLPRFWPIGSDSIAGDSFDVLLRKVSKYTTTDYHVTNWTLKELIRNGANFPLYSTNKPEIFSISPRENISPSQFYINGRNFGATQDTSTVNISGLNASVIHWSDTQIYINFPTGQLAGPREVTVTTAAGVSNVADFFVIEPRQTTNFSLVQPNENGMFVLDGYGMCDTPGTVEFVPSFCVDSPPGSAACNNGDAAITFWSETKILGYIPPDYAPGTFGGAKIHCQYGGPLYPTMDLENNPPVLDPIANRVVNEGQNLNFTVTGSDPDGNLLTFSAQNLPVGASFSGQTFNWTPDYTQSGIYHVLFRVSDGLAVDEQDVTITVLNSPQPNLTLTSLVNLSQNVSPGSQLTLQNTVKNIGTTTAGSFVIAFHLSGDSVYGGADDIAITATRTIATLGVNVQNGANTILTVPAATPTGNYYLCAIADGNNTVTESNESDNSRCTTTTVLIEKPDLVVLSLSGPTAALTGTVAAIMDTIKNQGLGGGTGSFTVGIYLSVDPVITTADTRVGVRNVSTLAAGATNSATTNITIPATLAPGNYFWGAIADITNTRAETDEANNALTGNPVNLSPGGDIVVTSLNGPVEIVSGSKVTLTDTVVNQGVGAIGSFTVGYYLSTDPVITTSDRLISNRGISSLASGATNAGVISASIPVNFPSGIYYWGAIADYSNQRPEANESNNTFVGSTVNATPGPDLIMTVVTAPSVATRGTQITVNNTVFNQGTGTSTSSYVGIYVSTDPVITKSDRYLTARFVGNLVNGYGSSSATTVTLPTNLTVGNYYIGVIADFDNRSIEQNENNNALAGNLINIQ